MHTYSCSIVRSQLSDMSLSFCILFLTRQDSFLISFGSDKCCYCHRACLIVYSRIPHLEMESTGPCTQMGGGVFHVFKFLSCRRTFGSSGSRHQTLCPFAILGAYLLSSSVTDIEPAFVLRSLMLPSRTLFPCLAWLTGMLGVSGFLAEGAIV
jgi:hypothetical protein